MKNQEITPLEAYKKFVSGLIEILDKTQDLPSYNEILDTYTFGLNMFCLVASEEEQKEAYEIQESLIKTFIAKKELLEAQFAEDLFQAIFR